MGVFAVSTASSVCGQAMIWDHIGDGLREQDLDLFEQLGDLDGDGVPDFIISDPDRGFASIRSGSDASLIKQHSFPSENLHQTRFGRGMANLGLIDGDAVEDYCIGATGYSPAGGAEWGGLVRVFSGATHQVVFDLHENNPWEFFGDRVVNLGDVNGDGLADFGVSNQSDGRFRVYLGPNAIFLREHPGTHSDQSFASFGDHDGDGCADYLIGQSDYPHVDIGHGAVRLFSGRTGELLLLMEGDQLKRFAGFSVSRGGDWNGDGFEDVVTGAPGTGAIQSTSNSSGVYVFSGADGSILHFFDGEAYCHHNSGFGWSVSSGKDVNGDGVPDLLVGAPMEPYAVGGGISTRGSAFLISGATKGVLWEFVGQHIGQLAGGRVKLIDDHNGDGLADWAVLSPHFDGVVGSAPHIPFLGRLSVFAGAFGDIDPSCSGGPNSVSPGAVLWNSGPISVRENALELVVSEMPQQKPAILIHGRQTTPAQPFGLGELCLATPLSILAIETTGSNGPPGTSDHALFSIDLEAPPFTSAGGRVQAGDTWAFQVLYRDQGVRNTSNALSAQFLP